MANTDVLQVVALALFHPVKKRYLIVRRNSQQTSGAGHWEFPGGKIDAGETQTQALKREITEELGFTLNETRLKYVHTNLYEYPQRTVELHLYKYEQEIDHFMLVDHDLQAWVNEAEMAHYQLAPADIPFIKYLF